MPFCGSPELLPDPPPTFEPGRRYRGTIGAFLTGSPAPFVRNAGAGGAVPAPIARPTDPPPGTWTRTGDKGGAVEPRPPPPKRTRRRGPSAPVARNSVYSATITTEGGVKEEGPTASKTPPPAPPPNRTPPRSLSAKRESESPRAELASAPTVTKAVEEEPAVATPLFGWERYDAEQAVLRKRAAGKIEAARLRVERELGRELAAEVQAKRKPRSHRPTLGATRKPPPMTPPPGPPPASPPSRGRSRTPVVLRWWGGVTVEGTFARASPERLRAGDRLPDHAPESVQPRAALEEDDAEAPRRGGGRRRRGGKRTAKSKKQKNKNKEDKKEKEDKEE